MTNTTTQNCVPTTTKATSNCCIHPFKFIFDTVAEALQNPSNRSSFAEVFDRVLDKGLVTTNCNICCPECGGAYNLASVETGLKFIEAVGAEGDFVCCSNVYASVETYLKYSEAVATNESVAPCCNGFNQCVDDLLCWATGDTVNGTETLDRILDKGIFEYGGILNNCSPARNSEICYLLQLIQEYNALEGSTLSRAEFIDILLDKGIAIGCASDGQIVVMSSTETYLKFAEAIGLTNNPAVPALGQSTTTTTVI